MDGPYPEPERIAERENASRRVRRLTLNAGALAAGVAGMIAAYVASKTPGHSVAQRTLAAATRVDHSVPTVPAPAATVATGSATPAPPQSAPAASSSAPVAVSGGS